MNIFCLFKKQGQLGHGVLNSKWVMYVIDVPLIIYVFNWLCVNRTDLEGTFVCFVAQYKTGLQLHHRD